MKLYKDFKKRFKLLASKHRHLVVNTLSNIFTMRLIGNKTHGDLAEIGIVEFIKSTIYYFILSYWSFCFFFWKIFCPNKILQKTKKPKIMLSANFQTDQRQI